MCNSFYCTGFDGYAYSGLGTNPFINRRYVAYSALNSLFDSFYPERIQRCSCSDTIGNLLNACPPTGYINGDADFMPAPGSNIPPMKNELSGLGYMPEIPTFTQDTSGLPEIPDANLLGMILSPDIMSAGAMPPMADPMLAMMQGATNDPMALMGLMSLMSAPSAKPQQKKPSGTNNNSSVQSVQISPNDSTQVSHSADGKVKIGAAVFKRIQQIAQKINCDPQDLMATIYKESKFETNAWNGHTAVGLIQWTQIAIDDLNQNYGMNLTKEKIAAMDVMQQLDLAEITLVREKEVAGFAKNQRLSAADLYAMNYLPGKAKQQVLASRGENYYERNAGLDINRDGRITKDELNSRVQEGRRFVSMA